MKTICVYKICSISHPERVYIGSTIDFELRKKRHLFQLGRKNHINGKILNHVSKHSIDDLYFEILEILSKKEDTLIREQFYIDLYNPYFNICKIAGSQLGVKRSEETKKKMGLWQIGRKMPPMSEDQKSKIRNFQTGRKKPRSVEHHEKLTGINHPLCKLKKEDVFFIRSSNLKQREIAEKFGMSQPNISAIQNYRIFKNI